MKNFNWTSQQKPLLLSLIVFIVFTLITFYYASNIKRQIENSNRHGISVSSEKIANQLQELINHSVFDLYTLQSFYTTHDQINYQEFKQFTQLQLANIDYIKALEWIPKVTQKERVDFVNEQQALFSDYKIKALMPDKTIQDSQIKDVYFPVTFVEPLIDNENALGLDLNSDQSRRRTLEYARDTAKITATEQISLVQDESSSKDFLMLAPIYQNGIIPITLNLKRQTLKGFVLGVFQINSLIKQVSEHAHKEGLQLSLIDLDSSISPLLYGQSAKPDFSFDIDVPERAWQLQFTMTPALRAQVESPPIFLWTLVIGFIISALLGISAYALTRISRDAIILKKLNKKIKSHNQSLEARVQERTQKIAMKNEELSNNVIQLTQSREALNKLMQELKKQKESAEHKSIELARSNKELDEFAYVASHDLKAPLRGIDQLASWIQEDLQNQDMDEIPEHLGAIRQRIKRLEKLLTDLLEYSKAGRHDEKLSEVDSQKLIEDVFMMNSPSDSCTLSFNNHLPQNLTVTAQFELIIRNLIGNAIKHSDKKNLHIEFDCIEKNNIYTFSIKDNGPGIDSLHFDQIFKMFKTLKPRDKVEGSGMGLALIKKVVNSYGGNIYVESTMGKGTTFFFNWPKNLHA